MTAVAVQLPTLHVGYPIVLELVAGTSGAYSSEIVLPLIHLPVDRKISGSRHMHLRSRIKEAPIDWPTLCGWTGILFIYGPLFYELDVCPQCLL